MAAIGSPRRRADFEIGELDADGDGDTNARDPETQNDHSLPNPEDAKMSQVSSGTSNSPFCSLGLWFVIIMLLLAATAVGLGIGLTRDKENNPTAFAGSFTAVTREGAKRDMRNYIVRQSVSPSNAFIDSDSPQSLALAFLADQDQLRLNAPKDGLGSREGYKFITRYVMAVFYFAMQGSLWNYDLLFLTKHDTCDWYDVFQPPVGQIGVLCNQNTEQIVGISFISNNLKGSLPSELGVLTTLDYLESIGDVVTGKIPDSFSQLTKLQTVILGYNSISGELPNWIGDSWQNLDFLYLSNNLLTGTVPLSFRNMQALEVLAMDDNSLSGSLDFLWDLPLLEFVYLEDNSFTGNFPASIVATNPNLKTFDVSTNLLYGRLPIDFFRLPRLKTVDLHENAFTGSIPSDITVVNTAELQFLALHQNKFSFSIPDSMGNMGNLLHLDLSENELTGDIPQTFANLNELTYLFLSKNNFGGGSIPAFIYTFTKLRELSLKGTHRTGRISELTEALNEIVLLDLDDNELTGPIPTEMGTLNNLEFLLLNRNDLSGEIPVEIGGLDSLRYLLADRNNITGTFQPICDKAGLSLVIADCSVDCLCCDECCDGNSTCHDNDLVSSVNPVWERGYERAFYDFSNETGFYIASSP